MTTDPLTELEAALASAHPDSLTCPTCGSPVRVVSSDEGTSYYEPIAEVRALREAPPLDEERLAQALAASQTELGLDWTSWRKEATDIAREYERLNHWTKDHPE